MERRKKYLSPRTRLLLTRGLIKAGSADASLRWIVTGIVLATIMFILALLIRNLGETHDEWVEYNRLSSHHSPSNGAASPPSHREGRPTNFPARGGESLSGAFPHNPHLVIGTVQPNKKKVAAPESQIITHPASRSPVMDRLMPQRQQNRSLNSAGDRQIENARQVERLLWDKGYRQPKAIVAILANGWHESRWNAGTVYREKNGTTSRGFFQLTNGALTIEGNVEQLTTQAPYAARIQKWYTDFKANDWSAGEAAYWFARRVEICASRFWLERKQTAERWWLLMEEHK